MSNTGGDRKKAGGGGEPAAAAAAADQCSPALITESNKNPSSDEALTLAAPATLSLPCVLIIGNALRLWALGSGGSGS